MRFDSESARPMSRSRKSTAHATTLPFSRPAKISYLSPPVSRIVAQQMVLPASWTDQETRT